METGYKVGDIMVRDVISVSPETKLIDCARQMAEKKIGCLVVIQDSKVIGIITEQDLARKVLAKRVNADTVEVREIMSNMVNIISPDKDIYDAFQLMGNNEIKHLPVVVGEKLLGIITSKDVLAIKPGLIELLSFKNSSR